MFTIFVRCVNDARVEQEADQLLSVVHCNILVLTLTLTAAAEDTVDKYSFFSASMALHDLCSPNNVQGDYSSDNMKSPDISLAVHGTPPRHSAC